MHMVVVAMVLRVTKTLTTTPKRIWFQVGVVTGAGVVLMLPGRYSTVVLHFVGDPIGTLTSSDFIEDLLWS